MRLALHTMVPLWVIGMAVVLVASITFAFRHVGLPLVINETPSEPLGVYRVVAHRKEEYLRGMRVLFAVPVEVRAIVYGRGWLRNGLPLMKEIQGLAGDRICIFANRLEINGRPSGPVFAEDSQGLPLPRLRGCFEVPAGCFFAASQRIATSFDGRYFGALPLDVLQGEARPVWTF